MAPEQGDNPDVEVLKGGEVVDLPEGNYSILNYEISDTGALVDAVSRDPEDETPEAIKDQLLENLRRASRSEARVRIFAIAADKYGLEAIIGMVLPTAGDFGTSAAAFSYLAFEAKKAGLSSKSIAKIAGFQGLDFAAGFLPFIGDAADFFIQANVLSYMEFVARSNELTKQALKAGVPQEEIDEILKADNDFAEGHLERLDILQARKRLKAQTKAKGLLQSD